MSCQLDKSPTVKGERRTGGGGDRSAHCGDRPIPGRGSGGHRRRGTRSPPPPFFSPRFSGNWTDSWPKLRAEKGAGNWTYSCDILELATGRTPATFSSWQLDGLLGDLEKILGLGKKNWVGWQLDGLLGDLEKIRGDSDKKSRCPHVNKGEEETGGDSVKQTVSSGPASPPPLFLCPRFSATGVGTLGR